ncbi:CXXC-type zinc finger protein 1-like [Eudromia elegans]
MAAAVTLQGAAILREGGGGSAAARWFRERRRGSAAIFAPAPRSGWAPPSCEAYGRTGAAILPLDSEFSDAEAPPGGAQEEDEEEDEEEEEEEENAPVYCVCRKPDINCFMIGCDGCNEWFHGECINITERMAKGIREWYCQGCREKDPSLEIRYRHKKSREREPERDKGELCAKGQELEQGRAAKVKRSARMCGECEACRRPEDCGACDFCRDMKKFGGPNKIRQKCRLRQCQLRARESYKYFPSSELCGGAFDEQSLGWLSEAEDVPVPERSLRKRALKVKHVKRRERKNERKKEERHKRHRQRSRHRERSRRSDRPDAWAPGARGQCLGPGCTRAARPPSKYCSEACGVELAASRIYEILPQRIQQWQQSPCVAEEQGKRLLERIRREQHQARLRLQELERRFHELEGLIARAKGHPPRHDEESNDGDSDDTDLQIFCVSCGHPVNPKVALRHMERCYAKYESQTSFGSMYPTRIEGATRLFCDVYNPQSRTYCKRLQVLCPEHCREPKVPADEVCGCPLVRDVFELTGDFCRVPKRRCHRHYSWERLRRAELDLERVRLWYKLDELFEQERNVRAAMTNRAGLLALMLHQTIQHDPLTSDLRTPPAP